MPTMPFVSRLWKLLPLMAAACASCIRVPAPVEAPASFKPAATHTGRSTIRPPEAARTGEPDAGGAEWTPRSSPSSAVPGSAGEPDVMVWMIADELHTGIVFPFDWLVENGLKVPAGLPHGNYVALSWGNRQAYVQREWLTPWQAVRAMCAPSPSVMEMIPFDFDVVPVCEQQRIWRRLVPRERGAAVAAYLNGCMKSDSGGAPVLAGESSWGKGVLIESPFSYYIPRVCNVWTAQAIEACGVEMHLWGTMTSGGIIRQAEKEGFQKIWDGWGKKAS